MARSVELVVEGVFESGAVAAGFDDVGDHARRMGDDVDSAARVADDGMSRVSDGADNMGSSASQAAGGLGDLGGALGAMPGPLGALGSGMETVAPLVMGVTGATDLLTLAMNSNIVMTVRQSAAAAANAVKTGVMTTASKAAAVGQWALNAALNANPIGAVVLVVGLLVGALVLAYQKSDTFRRIVDTAFGAAKTAIDKVVGILGDLLDPILDVIKKVPDMQGIFQTAGTLIQGYIQLWVTPIEAVVAAVKWLIEHVKDIDFPKVPDLNPFNRSSSGGSSSGGFPTKAGTAAADRVTVNVYAQTLDARTLDRLTRRYGISLGGAVG